MGNINHIGLYRIFYEELNKKELIYQFPLVDSLGASNNPKIVFPNKNKNILSFPDIRINKVLKEIIGLIKEACNKFNLSYETNRYYISSRLSESQNTSFWYDQSSASRPALFAILSLADFPVNIKINSKTMSLNPGDVLISEAGNKIIYLESFKSLSIQVLPVSELKGQYLEKWIPIY